MFSHIQSIARGKTLMRTLMNERVRRYALAGLVVDIGGGEGPSYLEYFSRRSLVRRVSLDGASSRSASVVPIDLERDALPFPAGAADTVLLFNILEHIFNHTHLLAEVRRIIAMHGVVYGFVPFFINYHPDPHDFFRYTKEALARLFAGSGFETAELAEIGTGPFGLIFNIMTVIAAPLSPLIALFFPFFYAADRAYQSVRPHAIERFPLGYFFVLRPR